MSGHRSCTIMWLFPVWVIKEGIAGDGLGLDMYEAHRDGEEMPELDLNLPQELEKLEELIRSMTSFHPRDRPSAEEISSRLLVVISEVITKTWLPSTIAIH